MMIELTDTDSAAIAAEFVRGPHAGRQPGDGHGDDAWSSSSTRTTPTTRWRSPAQASHEHPARVLGVILGDARGAAQVNAQVGTGAGWSGETALIRLKGEVVKHPESVVLPLLLPDSPVAVWWPTRPAGGPAADPLGALAQRRITDAAAATRGKAQGDATRSARRTPRATPTWPGPGSRRGARCSPPRSTSTRSRSPARSVTAERISPSADLLAAWLARPAQGRRRRARTPRARASPRSCWRPRRGRSRISRAGRQAGDVLLARAPGPADRAASAATCPSCSPRSCAGSTRTTSTPRPRRGCSRWAAPRMTAAPRSRSTRTPPTLATAVAGELLSRLADAQAAGGDAADRADRRHHRRRRSTASSPGSRPRLRGRLVAGRASGGATSGSSRPTPPTATSARPARPSSTPSAPTRPRCTRCRRPPTRPTSTRARRRTPTTLREHGAGEFDV